MMFDQPWEPKDIVITREEAQAIDYLLTMTSYSEDYLGWLMNKDFQVLRYQAGEIMSKDTAGGTLHIEDEGTMKTLLAIIPITLSLGPEVEPVGLTLKRKLYKSCMEIPKEEKIDTANLDKLLR